MLRALHPALIWVLAAGYLASWVRCGVVGQFADAEGLAFWLMPPIQFLYWVVPYLVIAMLVGIGVTVFAFLIRRRARKAIAAAAVALLAVVAFLVLLNLPGSPVARLGEVGLLSRLSSIANVQHGTPGWVRLQVWRGLRDGWTRQLRGEEVRVVDINALRALAPLPRASVPRPSRPQPRTLQPRWSRRHSGNATGSRSAPMPRSLLRRQ
jgi:hypothetical protein